MTPLTGRFLILPRQGIGQLDPPGPVGTVSLVLHVLALLLRTLISRDCSHIDLQLHRKQVL